MVKSSEEMVCSPSADGTVGCCSIEAVVSIDERGQMILPKVVRDKAGVKAGDKLAVMCMEKEGHVCCISLIKVEAFTGMVKSMLGPVMKEIF